MNPAPHRPIARSGRGFTLVELLTVILVVSALMTLFVPLTQWAMARARATACMNNLRGLGAALQLYLGDNNNTFPKLVMAREDKNSNEPAIDNTLNAYTGGLAAFRCGADTKGLWQTTGTSYLWNSLINGQNAASMNFMGIANEGAMIPVISDKESFHQYQKVQVNILYADGHAAKDIQFVAGGSQ